MLAAYSLALARARTRGYFNSLLEVAVFEAMKAVTNRVKSMTGIDDEDGYRLMGKVFSELRIPEQLDHRFRTNWISHSGVLDHPAEGGRGAVGVR